LIARELNCGEQSDWIGLLLQPSAKQCARPLFRDAEADEDFLAYAEQLGFRALVQNHNFGIRLRCCARRSRSVRIGTFGG
jgi:hypothetical protein